MAEVALGVAIRPMWNPRGPCEATSLVAFKRFCVDYDNAWASYKHP